MQGTLSDNWEAPRRWRYRCPNGHAQITPTSWRESAYCQSCNQSYGVEQIQDLATENLDPSTV